MKLLEAKNLYFIASTINVDHVEMEFSSKSASSVRAQVNVAGIDVGGAFSWQSENSLKLDYKEGIAIGFKAAAVPRAGTLSDHSELPLRGEPSLTIRPISLVLPVPQVGQGSPNTATVSNDFPDPTAPSSIPAAAPTHSGPSPMGDISSLTYGELLAQITKVLNTAGIDETRVIPLGTGFAVVTSLEVLEDDGTTPLAGPSRFFIGGTYRDRRERRGVGTVRAAVSNFTERRRAYVIAVDGKSIPQARSDDPEMMFRFSYPFVDLSDRTKPMRVDPGTQVRVFVYEFSKYDNNPSTLLSYGDCGEKLVTHLTQDHLWK